MNFLLDINVMMSLSNGESITDVHFCDSPNHGSQMVHTQCGRPHLYNECHTLTWFGFHSSAGNATEHACLWRLNLSLNTLGQHATIIANTINVVPILPSDTTLEELPLKTRIYLHTKRRQCSDHRY